MDLLYFYLELFTLILIYFGAVFVHELGHVLAAWMVGWVPMSMTLGEGLGWNLSKIFGMQFRISLDPFGGSVMAFPRGPRFHRISGIIFAAGGPAASIFLTLAIVGLLLPLRVRGHHRLVGKHALFWRFYLPPYSHSIAFSPDLSQIWSKPTLRWLDHLEVFTHA